jgi:hypothetical protein
MKRCRNLAGISEGKCRCPDLFYVTRREEIESPRLLL